MNDSTTIGDPRKTIIITNEKHEHYKNASSFWKKWAV
jgi:hypothetical protein